MSNYISIFRPKQWVKQGFVFLPLLSLGLGINLQELFLGIVAMLVFTSFSGLVYFYNDLRDLEFDRLDSVRANRALASGKLNIKRAYFLVFFITLIATSLVFWLSSSVKGSWLCLFAYLVINWTYSTYRLKRFNILGITMVALGFPLRFTFGCFFLGVPFSYWAFTLLSLLALFMLSIKRYQMSTRNTKSLSPETHDFWLLAAVTFAAFFSASYAGFVTSKSTQQVWGSTSLLFSSIPVALGMVRFIELGTNRSSLSSEDATESVAKDLPIAALGLIYIAIMLTGKITTP
jgi:decaprenyl-phosphate phosphoribosyltransferase